jgi:hypothetical protein
MHGTNYEKGTCFCAEGNLENKPVLGMKWRLHNFSYVKTSLRATFLLQTPALNVSSPVQSILLHAKLPQQRNSAGGVHCGTTCSQGPSRPVDLCAILRTAGLSATAVGNIHNTRSFE